MRLTCRIAGCDRPPKGRGLCQSHYAKWWRTVGPDSEDGLGVCECLISRPAPKCCRRCGYPCVHRMAPRIRDRALDKKPPLRDQEVECLL